ncbi:FAD-dependent oxidoreductase [Streptomyces sp. NPDC048623]|uniref:NAD(P)/FAD-dependent oxidoreductase n=1 Tax=Streptomyces sp. NPDC048623 TaxID=3155761 RepID=UPI0034183676
MGSGTVVVGAGQAGLQLAVSLRQAGDEEPIVLVGEEPHAPYQRPPLSKDFLAGRAGQDSLAFRDPAYYEQAGIRLLTGERVTGAEPGLLHTASGRTLPYERLALTLGAEPVRLPVEGVGLQGVCTLRGIEDARTLRERLARAERVVVVGGGFIGLETAAAARSLGVHVTVVEAGDRLMARAVAPVVSEFYRQAHTRQGTEVLLSAAVAGFEGADGHVRAAVLADGTRLPADLVLLGVGVRPRTGPARELGVEVDGGIVVDACSRTNVPGVVAAGDCTVRPHPLTGEGRLRLESVPSAVAQAQAAAASLLGRSEPDTSVPWFWSNQGALRLQIAGLSAGHDTTVVRGDPASGQFSVLYYRQGTLLAADAVNRPADYMAVRRALTKGEHLPADRAGDAGVPLKRLLTEGAAGVR